LQVVRGHSIEKLPRWRDCTLPRWSMWKITILSTCNIIHLPHESQANSCPNLFPYVSLTLLCDSPELLFDIFNVYLNCFPKFPNMSHEKQVPRTSNDIFLGKVWGSQLCHLRSNSAYMFNVPQSSQLHVQNFQKNSFVITISVVGWQHLCCVAYVEHTRWQMNFQT